MKQNYVENQVEDQIQLTIRDVNSGIHHLAIRLQPNTDLPNIFLIQNKGKGPPGRTRNPVRSCCLIPDNQPATLTGGKIHSQTNNKRMNLNIKYQIFNHN